MGGMMQRMGAPKPKDLYPSLMELPDLPLERRQEIQSRAHERMQTGIGIVSDGLHNLSAAAAQDYRAMENATVLVREGLAQFESGLAAHRAIAEGKSPRNVALRWFKREMNLFPASGAGLTSSSSTTFHYVVIGVLGTFSAAVVWMYFFKMRRAAALLERLASGEGAGSGIELAFPPPAPMAGTPVLEQKTPESEDNPPKRWKGTLRIARIFVETPKAKTFRLTDPGGAPLPFTYRPGQFLTLTVTPEGKPAKRSYTIASSPTQKDYLEITVKREESGLVSRFLHDQVKEGDFLQIAAPAGRFIFTGMEASSVVLIAGGVGITPMMSVLRYLTDRAWPGEIDLVYACRTSADLIFREEIDYRRKRYPNLRVTVVLSQEEKPPEGTVKGRVTAELLSRQVPDLKSRRVHICGPRPMMDAVKQALLALGLPQDQIRTEAFGPAMGTAQSTGSTGVAERPAQDRAGRAAAISASVSFARSRKSAPLPADKTVLDVADDIGVEIENSCRQGTCGTCKIKLLSGEVSMEVQDGLDPEDKERNIVLACQAKSKEDISVDA